MRFDANVYVTLKPKVNDPQGLTIMGALKALGFDTVRDLSSGKFIKIALDADDRAMAEERIDEMCKKLLANPVIENYEYFLEENPAA